MDKVATVSGKPGDVKLMHSRAPRSFLKRTFAKLLTNRNAAMKTLKLESPTLVPWSTVRIVLPGEFGAEASSVTNG